MRLAKASDFLKAYWGPMAVILGPPVVVATFVLVQGIPWLAVQHFVGSRWGEVASAWGFLIGIYVLVIAQGVKKAAEEARARERERTVVEELEEAANKIQQVGLFANVQQWDLVRLRGEEVLSSCRSTAVRWGEYLSEDARNDLLTATTIVRSIAQVAAESSIQPLTQEQRRSIHKAQLEASELLSTVLGEARRIHEKEE